MRLILHREIPEDENLRTQWNALVGQMESPQVFYTYEWAQAMSRAYGQALIPLLMLAYRDDRLVGVASLASDLPGAQASFLAGTTADYCDFISSPADRPGLIRSVFAHLRELGFLKIALANLPADSCSAQLLPVHARKDGYNLFSRPAYRCARVELHSEAERTSVKQAVERKPLVRRQLKAMGKIAPVSIEHLTEWDRIAPALSTFFQAHVTRFLATGRISNLAKAQRRSFLAELARLLAAQGWIACTRMLLGNTPVAWNYGFRFAGSWFWYQPTFDNNLQDYSPGFCLLSRIVEEACDSAETSVVDLGLGAEGYKERMTNAVRQTLHVTAQTSLQAHYTTAVRYRAAEAIKIVPQVESTARRLTKGVDRFRHYVQQDGTIQFASCSANRIRRALAGRDEVLFFARAESRALSSSLNLLPTDLESLARAAMRYENDEQTQAYLLRSAERIKLGGAQGFVLADDQNVPVHICWVTEFSGFYMAELDVALEAPSPASVLLFDCWTPVAVRGHGYYAEAISRAADELQASGKQPWIFSASTNRSSIRGLEKAGFVRRFSLLRKRWLFTRKITRVTSFPAVEPIVDALADRLRA